MEIYGFTLAAKKNVTINSQANSCGREAKWFITTHTFNALFFIILTLPLSTDSSDVSCVRIDIEICDSFETGTHTMGQGKGGSGMGAWMMKMSILFSH